MKAQQTQLMVMKAHEKGQNRLCWAVQSTSGTKTNGYPTFHIVTWDEASSSWVCPCPARKPCIHMRLASEASQDEQQRIDAAFDALTATKGDEEDRPLCATCCKVIEREEGTCIDCGEPLHFACVDHGRCSNCQEWSWGTGETLGDIEAERVIYGDDEMAIEDAPQQYPDYDDSNPRRDELEVLMKAEPIMARRDTGPRLYREPLAERVREVM
jgi:hypothetical protein